jgi:hypothetical protein
VGIVALSSLLGGFVVVFGGGMLALRGPGPPATLPPVAVSGSDGAIAPVAQASAPDASGAGPSEDAGGPGATTATGVAVAALSVNRCFAGMAPTPVAGAQCGSLAALDRHFAAKASDIAACGRGHGSLAFVMDFRFSTSFVRAWGGPSSTIPDAGAVAACVRRVTAPLPLAQVPHAYDRYVVTLGVTWP